MFRQFGQRRDLFVSPLPAAAHCQRSPLLFLLLLASRSRPRHVVLVRARAAAEKVVFFRGGGGGGEGGGFCLWDEAALGNVSEVSRYLPKKKSH